MRGVLALFLMAALLPAAGCAGRSDMRKGAKAAVAEKWDEAVLHYAKAAAEHPKNMQYRMKLLRARQKAAQAHVERGKRYQKAALYRQAAEEYQQALALDPTHQFAADELAKTLKYLEEAAAKNQGMSIDEMKAEASKTQATPRLHPQANIPIKIKFADQDIKDIFTALCKAAGLNVLFDSTVTDRKISVDLQDVTFLQAMEILGIQTGTFYKVIDPYTIIIAPDNRQKRQEYEDQVIKTFYLSNAMVKDVFALLRGLIDARNIAQNDQLNAITIKDSPDKVAVAERIIRSNDKAKGEVVIEVELLEVNKNKSLNFGLTHPGSVTNPIGTLGFSPITPGTDTGDGKSGIRLHEMDLLNQQHNWLVGPLPSFSYSLFKTVSDARVLAQPQLRVTEGEKAQVHIGTQEPVPTTTFSAVTAGTTGVQPVTNYSYQNVGIKIQVEARVHHNQEVTLKVQVEISSIVNRLETGQPIIGTRTIDTVIRLMDGQVNVLAGLIKEDESDSLAGLPGVVDTPILKRLFGKTGKSKTQTDIVLSLKPNIIRMPNITTEDLKPVWVGSGERVKLMEELPPQPSILMGKDSEKASPASQIPSRQGVQPAEPASRRQPQTPESGETPEAAPKPASTGPPARFAPAAVSITPSNLVLDKDEVVEMEIRIESQQAVMHAPVTLAYNASVFHVVEVSEGGFMRQQGQNVTFVQSVDNEKGSVVIGCSAQEGAGANGAGALVRLKIKGVSAGVSALAMRKVELKNAEGHVISARLSHGRVQVSDVP